MSGVRAEAKGKPRWGLSSALLQALIQDEEFLVDRSETFTVGRSSRVHFPMVEDLALSREHFQVDNEPPHCHLVDLGSTNGTKVNGLRVGLGTVARRRRDRRR